jgi:hypothetical protein
MAAVYCFAKKGQEREFRSHWISALSIEDRSMMVGEFLSQPTGHENFPWVTWDLRNEEVSSRDGPIPAVARSPHWADKTSGANDIVTGSGT